jgi:hypothetical protein
VGVNSYRIGCVVLLTCWTISLALNVATYRDGMQSGTLTGLDMLVWGWLGIGFQNGWYANLIFFVSIALFLAGRPMSPREARVALWLLLLLLANALLWRSVPRGDIGGTTPITGFGPGYYLWFAVQLSMVAMLWHRSKRIIQEQSE